LKIRIAILTKLNRDKADQQNYSRCFMLIRLRPWYDELSCYVSDYGILSSCCGRVWARTT